MAQRNGNHTDENGRAVEGAEVYVYTKTGDVATITDTSDNPITHPVITDQDGNYAYRADDGYYIEHTWVGKRLVQKEIGVFIGDPNLSFQVANESVLAAAQQAEEAEELSRLYAVSDTDAPISGAVDIADRGAKYFSGLTAADRAATLTLKGQAESARDQSVTAQGGAIIAQAAAETAALAAALAGPMYPDEATGRAAVADNAFFTAIGTTSTKAIDIWRRINSGSSTLFRTIPDITALTIPTLYANAGGTGNRTSLITATASAGLIAATYFPDRLVNGSTSGNTTAAAIVFVAVTTTGHYLMFDFGPGGKKVIDEAKWYQTGTNTHGTWKWQATNDAIAETAPGSATWTDIGASFTLGGSATQTQTQLSTNTAGYRFYRLLGVSGTASAAQFVYEIEFKIAAKETDQLVGAPTAGAPGDYIGKANFRNFDTAWFSRYGVIPTHVGVNRLGLFMMDDDATSTVIRNRLADQHHFDFTSDRATYGAAPVRTPKGWKFRDGLVRQSTTSITGLRMFGIVYRTERGNNTRFDVSTSISGEYMYLRGSEWRAGSNGSTVTAIAPNGEILAMPDDTPGSGSTARDSAHWINRGNWVMVFVEANSALGALGALRMGLGGDPDTTISGVAAYADDLEIAYLGLFDAPLSSAQKKAEANWLLPILARDRDIRIRIQETSGRKADVLLMWGQSNIGGDAPLWDTPRQLLSMQSIPSVLIQAANRKDRPWRSYPAPYDAGTSASVGALQPSVANNGSYNYEQHNDRKYGPDWQIARLHNLASGRARQLVIHKVGADGTILAAPGEGGGGATSWHPLTAWNIGVLGHAMTRLYETMQWLIAHDIGFDIVAFWWGQGETTVGSPANTVQTANWGDDYNDLNAACVTLTAGMWPTRKLITRLRAWETGVVGDATLTGQLRTIQDALGSADPTNVKILSADGTTADVWGRTPGYHPEVGGQLLHYNGALLDRLATDADALIPWSSN